MKKHKKILPLCLLTLLLTVLLSVPASAAGGYSDVPPGSACYEAVTYLAERGITSGTGGNCYSPDDLITVRQWAVMLCRAYLPDTLRWKTRCIYCRSRDGPDGSDMPVSFRLWTLQEPENRNFSL